MLRPCWLGFALVLMLAPLPAPGQYPGGNGNLGIPFPRRHKKQQQAQLESTSGMLRRIEKDQVILEADDHRILNFKRTTDTHFLKMGKPIQPSDLVPGDYIEVESSADEEGFLTAVNVAWQQDGSAQDRAHAAEPVETSVAKSSHDKDEREENSKSGAKESASKAAKETPEPETAKPPAAPAAASTPPAAAETNPADLSAPVHEKVRSVQIDPDDQGPPILKRSGGGHREAEPAPPSAVPATDLSARNEAPPSVTAPAAPAAQRPEEVVIEKAREAAGGFLESLPNYFCQEIMTRYQTESNSKNWQPIDVVSMALVYENGHESYRNLAINGKPTKKNIEDLPGSWSTGEFGTVLADIFSPATAADFEFRKESRIEGRESLVYDFSVEREHSHWQIMVASQLIKPSYQGSVWIDKETNRVLRIEMQATHIPDAFPSDKVEMATDYEFVRFDDRQFLVPVHAESLGCQRDTSGCNRNAIDFRNYHKYAGESTITFEK
ncbi:MAG TPA: hypothetical protein VMG35_06255 [Bryobacteraceae bacterium]|nr:hypothetical protein [Bryobacteraceae bacterium]